MLCDHKRVWEMRCESPLYSPASFDVALEEGFEPYAPAGDSYHFFKRLAPCQTCLEEQEREKKHVDPFTPNQNISNNGFPPNGTPFIC